MKILVTGANGYIGQGIVKKLLDNNVEVVATDFESNNIDNRAIIKTCDLFQIANPYEFFERPEKVLHLAWRGIYNHYSNDIICDLPKHFCFLEELIKNGCKNISVLGSMHEIGKHEGIVDDSTKRNPNNYYGICKNALRELLEANKKNYDFNLQWLVGFYVISNNIVDTNGGGNVFNKILLAEKNGKKEFPFVKGEHKFDFVDYNEFIDMIFYSIKQNKINGIIYCGTGVPISLKDRVERFIKDNKLKISMKYGEYPERNDEPSKIYCNPAKINSIIKNHE